MNPANALLELAGSERCAGCGVPGAALCTRCGASLRPPVRADPVAGVDRVLCPFDYDGLARDLVLALKLSGRRGAARPLVDAMWAVAVRQGLRASVATWVPGRTRDVRSRGFDHANLLAVGLGRKLGVPVRRLLDRHGARPDQTSLTASGRRANMRGAFIARSCTERVLVVDDLVTTGATAAACARALRQAGAAGVEVIAACRAS